jgi:glycosyltransferase involved in cell wall biosynthesis
MKILIITDDTLGPTMAGSALRAWEMARVLAREDHELRIAAAPRSTLPCRAPIELVAHPSWRWAEAVIAPPWSLHLPAFIGDHRLIVDGATPLLAELAAMPATTTARRRRRTAAARLPLVAARADAVLAAGAAQHDWWRALLRRRPELPVLDVPFGIPDDDPADEEGEIAGVPDDWPVVLWWGGVWPWLDLDTLLAARARLGGTLVSIVVPTASRPGSSATSFTSDDLQHAAARHGLTTPAVVALDNWTPYAERHLVLNRASAVGVLHHPGPEAELSFRTRALDALWTGTPLLLSSGGQVATIAADRGWGEVVAPHDPAAVADALLRLLDPDEQARRRAALAADREHWRWSRVAEPLVATLPGLPSIRRNGIGAPLLRAAGSLLGLSTPKVPS